MLNAGIWEILQPQDLIIHTMNTRGERSLRVRENSQVKLGDIHHSQVLISQARASHESCVFVTVVV